jgi:hypothetical protein
VNQLRSVPVPGGNRTARQAGYAGGSTGGSTGGGGGGYSGGPSSAGVGGGQVNPKIGHPKMLNYIILRLPVEEEAANLAACPDHLDQPVPQDVLDDQESLVHPECQATPDDPQPNHVNQLHR